MSLKKARIRPATREDVNHLEADTFGKTMKAYVIDLDGEAIAIAGVLHTSLNQAFSKLTEEAEKRPVMIMKLAKKTVELFKTYPTPIYAVASNHYETSDDLLVHLGFEFDEICGDRRYYKWQ